MAQKTISVSMSGLSELLKKMDGNALEKVRQLSAGLYAEGELTMGEAKDECPVDTGALRSSGHVKLPEQKGTVITVEMGFGGPAAPYALRQHEENKEHSKFLERPATARAAHLTENIAARIKD